MMMVFICSPTTPPGTKVKLVGKVAVQNGFLLLKQTSLEVLGGTVEALYKKWVSQKVYFTVCLAASKIIYFYINNSQERIIWRGVKATPGHLHSLPSMLPIPVASLVERGVLEKVV
jgi:hypothetical protein